MAAGISTCSRVNFTDEESNNKTLMKKVVRILKQITAQSPPVAFTSTVPLVVSPAEARTDLLSNITSGSTDDTTNGETNGMTKETSKKKKRDAVLPGQKEIPKENLPGQTRWSQPSNLSTDKSQSTHQSIHSALPRKVEVKE